MTSGRSEAEATCAATGRCTRHRFLRHLPVPREIDWPHLDTPPAGTMPCGAATVWKSGAPPDIPPGAVFSGSGFSATSASVVSNMLAMEAALSSADRQTFAGVYDAGFGQILKLLRQRVEAHTRRLALPQSSPARQTPPAWHYRKWCKAAPPGPCQAHLGAYRSLRSRYGGFTST